MRILYLPYEIRSREFINYQYLANEVLKAGAVDKVFIGDRETLQKLALLGLLMPGVWYLKSAQSYMIKKLKRLRTLKFKTIVHDAEAVCDYELNGFHDCFMKPTSSLKYVDSILTSLKSETRSVKVQNPKLRVEKSGFLRFAHLRKKNLFKSIYKDEINDIKKKYNKYIYVVLSGTCAKFGSFNIFDDYRAHLKNDGMEDWHADLICEWTDVSHLCFFTLLDFIRLIITNTEYKIVLRPHPSEDKLFLTKLFKGFKDVFIDDDFSLQSSILASSKTILCPVSTTNFECAILEKESYCLLPKLSKYENKMIDLHFSNSITTRVFSAQELYQKILNNEKISNKVLAERKKNALDYAGLSSQSIKIFTDLIGDLSRGFKRKRRIANLQLNLQKFILITSSYLYRYLNTLLIKNLSYINHKIKGSIEIPKEDLIRMYPQNIQYKLGNFYLITNKKG